MDHISAPLIIGLLGPTPGIDCREGRTQPVDHIGPLFGHRVVSRYEDPAPVWNAHKELGQQVRVQRSTAAQPSAGIAGSFRRFQASPLKTLRSGGCSTSRGKAAG